MTDRKTSWPIPTDWTAQEADAVARFLLEIAETILSAYQDELISLALQDQDGENADAALSAYHWPDDDPDPIPF